jgi:predicted lipid-binding transport protein (Tim44 family)
MRFVMALLLAMMSVTASVLLAAEPAPAPTAPATTAPTSPPAAADKAVPEDPKPVATPKEAAAAATAEPKETGGKGPVKNADKAPSPQRFIPSEQVRPDFDVSFPIDI